jgi:radical SAM/Cys-rich protein
MQIESFRQILIKNGLKLTRDKTFTLQVNLGLLCNQVCRHCHLNAGPDRKEIMSAETVDQVVAYARQGQFEFVDITGGAPELNPNLGDLIEKLTSLAVKIKLRSNLTALNCDKKAGLIRTLKEHKVAIVASLPSFNESQFESQRGDGVFNRTINALKKLNENGYGMENSELQLDLASNPTGVFLPPPQKETEKRFRQVLHKKWGIIFNNFFNFANVPLGRFRQWLEETGNLEDYMRRLSLAFNPCLIEGLMCRKLVSVSWDGFLYDCDFNLAGGLPLGGVKIHISEMSGPPRENTPVTVSDHCFTCTAGAGFT